MKKVILIPASFDPKAKAGLESLLERATGDPGWDQTGEIKLCSLDFTQVSADKIKDAERVRSRLGEIGLLDGGGADVWVHPSLWQRNDSKAARRDHYQQKGVVSGLATIVHRICEQAPVSRPRIEAFKDTAEFHKDLESRLQPFDYISRCHQQLLIRHPSITREKLQEWGPQHDRLRDGLDLAGWQLRCVRVVSNENLFALLLAKAADKERVPIVLSGNHSDHFIIRKLEQQRHLWHPSMCTDSPILSLARWLEKPRYEHAMLLIDWVVSGNQLLGELQKYQDKFSTPLKMTIRSGLWYELGLIRLQRFAESFPGLGVDIAGAEIIKNVRPDWLSKVRENWNDFQWLERYSSEFIIPEFEVRLERFAIKPEMRRRIADQTIKIGKMFPNHSSTGCGYLNLGLVTFLQESYHVEASLPTLVAETDYLINAPRTQAWKALIKPT